MGIYRDYTSTITLPSGDQYVQAGSTNLVGDVATDTFVPVTTADTITGNGGYDQVDYSLLGTNVSLVLDAREAAGVALTPSPYGGTPYRSVGVGTATKGNGQVDRMTGIVDATGGSYDDNLTVTAGTYASHVAGRGGNDRIVDAGPAGDARVVADYAGSPAGAVVDLGAGTAQDGWGSVDALVNVHAVHGSSFNDALYGSGLADVFEASAGNDVIEGRGGNDAYDAQYATDGVYVDLGAGTVSKATGASGIALANAGSRRVGLGGTDAIRDVHTVFGSRYGDALIGSAGNDVFVLGEGNNRVDGGAGFDLVDFSGPSVATYSPGGGVVVDLGTGNAFLANGSLTTLRNVEGLVGTQYADRLTGTAANESLYGGAGNDVIAGGGGSDFLDGGDGYDTVVFGFSRATSNVALSGADYVVTHDGLASTARNFEAFSFTDGAVATGQLTLGGPANSAGDAAATQLRQWLANRKPAGEAGLFDRNYYLAHNPDVARAGVDPLAHFVANGWHEGRNPSALFDVASYLSRNPDVAAAGVDPLAHYAANGEAEGRAPDALFDARYYVGRYADVAAAGISPLAHYAAFGSHEGRAASASFDGGAYLARNPDVAAAGLDPLAHYLAYGQAEGRSVYPAT